MNIKASQSEDNGIAQLTDNDLLVYSVGISTGGVAEIRMAQANPKRHIIATTIDTEGVEFAQKIIAEQGFTDQIEAKLEDIANPLPYPDNHFDYVYARLVLHYLPEQTLVESLKEIYRALKPGSKFFVVVRSTKCSDATAPGVQYDPATHLSSKTETDSNGKIHTYSRFFHTEESIQSYIQKAGFSVSYVKSYDEKLYTDFMRTKLSPNYDNVIELLAVK